MMRPRSKALMEEDVSRITLMVRLWSARIVIARGPELFGSLHFVVKMPRFGGTQLSVWTVRGRWTDWFVTAQKLL